jgi:hypothetical protein
MNGFLTAAIIENIHRENDSSDEETSNSQLISTLKRDIRLRNDVSKITEQQLIKLFRINKSLFNYLFAVIEPEIDIRRSSAIPVHTQLLAFMRFLAIGDYQIAIGDDLLIGISQSSMSRIITKMLAIFEDKICPAEIKFPITVAEKTEVKKGFLQKFRYPGAIGAIDGTQIHLRRPNINEHLYVNKHYKHSINVQIIVDAFGYILSIDGTHGGSSHDASIYSLSAERQNLLQQYEQGEINTWLIADAGYPLEPFCITPFRNPRPGSDEARFNELHSKARIIVEATIGIWKNRYRVLLEERKLGYQPEKLTQIINATAALHNLCKKHQVPFNDIRDDNVALIDIVDHEDQVQRNFRAIGQNNRQKIMRTLFQRN